MIGRKLFALAAALAVAGVASAKDIYVAPGGPVPGEGTREKPYSDISVALLMGAYAGDVIHVAEGVYYGEGGVGKWAVKTPRLSIVGGYSRDFSARDPFARHTILARGLSEALVPLAKARGHDKAWGLSLAPTKASYNPGPLLQVDAEGVVVDGFWLEGYTRNTYKAAGDLRLDVGPVGAPLASFSQRGCAIRNCVVLNSAGPGIQMVAAGLKDRPETWNEVSNCVVANVLMAGIDLRVGTWDPDRAPDAGCALIRGNTVAFVWTHLGLGHGLVIGRQTRLTIEGNIFAYCEGNALHNGHGNDKALLRGNAFFENGGLYRYWEKEGSKAMVSCEDPALLAGKAGAKLYYLSDKSEGNYTADPGLPFDAAHLANFARAAGRLMAPALEQAAALLVAPAIDAGARGATVLPAYASAAKAAGPATDYAPIEYAAMKDHLGRYVELRVRLARSPEPSGFYVAGVGKDEWVCFRSADLQHFFYFRKGSEELAVAEKAAKDGEDLLLRGKLEDIAAAIKMKGKYGFVVEAAEAE